MKGKFHTSVNGFKSFEIFDADETSIFRFAGVLKDNYNFIKFDELIVGPDGIYWDFYNDGVMITLGWDNWSGVFIMSNSEPGDIIVTQIGNHINSVLS